MQACTHEYMCTHTSAWTVIYSVYTHIHTHTHTHACACAHTHTHTHSSCHNMISVVTLTLLLALITPCYTTHYQQLIFRSLSAPVHAMHGRICMAEAKPMFLPVIMSLLEINFSEWYLVSYNCLAWFHAIAWHSVNGLWYTHTHIRVGVEFLSTCIYKLHVQSNQGTVMWILLHGYVRLFA